MTGLRIPLFCAECLLFAHNAMANYGYFYTGSFSSLGNCSRFCLAFYRDRLKSRSDVSPTKGT